MSEIKKIAEGFGIEPAKIKVMVEAISTLESKALEWSSLADIEVTSIDEVEKFKTAADNRKSIKGTRIELVKFIKSMRETVQEQMSEYTKEDKAWLKISQHFESVAEEFEKKLAKVEKFKEEHEAKIKKELYDSRFEKLSIVCDSPADYPLDIMSEKAFEDLVESLTALKEKREKEETLQTERYEKVVNFIQHFDSSVLDTLGKLTQEDFDAKLVSAQKAKEEDDTAKAKDQKEKEETFIKRIEELKPFHTKFSSMVGMDTLEEVYQSVLEKAKAYIEPIIEPAKNIPSMSPTPLQGSGASPITTAPAVKVVERTSTAVGPKNNKALLEIWVSNFVVPEIGTKNLSEECLTLGKEIQAKFVGFKKWANLEISKLK